MKAVTKPEKPGLKQVCEFLWNLEEKHNLFQWRLNGVYVWEILRDRIGKKICEATGLYTQAHTQVTSGVKRLIKTILFELKNGALKKKYTRKSLIFENPRKVNFNGRFIDPYTYFYIKSLDLTEDVEIIDSSYLLSHYESEFKVKYNDHFSPGDFIRSRLLKIKVDKTCRLLEQEINEYFRIHLDFTGILTGALRNFFFNERYYLKLFARRKPGQVFLVCAYGNHPLVSAAKKQKIKVTEFQHGIITKYHLGYSFPGHPSLAYYPDELYLFGRFWKETVPFPANVKTVVYGYPYLKQISSQFSHISKKEKQILFLSQGSVGPQLAELAGTLARKLPTYTIIFKLHPGEFDRWQTYPALEKAGKLKNFEIITNAPPHLYELFASSTYTVGVFSTGLYEAIYHNCKIILVDLPGIDNMESLIEKMIPIVSSPDEIENIIQRKELTLLQADSFFE